MRISSYSEGDLWEEEEEEEEEEMDDYLWGLAL
jgi:hypothetical protein